MSHYSCRDMNRDATELFANYLTFTRTDADTDVDV
jgi:hypothetical protein